MREQRRGVPGSGRACPGSPPGAGVAGCAPLEHRAPAGGAGSLAAVGSRRTPYRKDGLRAGGTGCEERQCLASRRRGRETFPWVSQDCTVVFFLAILVDVTEAVPSPCIHQPIA